MNITTRHDSFFSYLRPHVMFANLWSRRQLIQRFTRREITQRYRGLHLGIIWSFISPLFLLIIYTVVFGLILKVRWAQSRSDNIVEFALTLFCGLLVFNIFSECVNKSSSLILNNRNYVKKVVFPLEILSVSTTITAFFHGLISLVVLIVAQAVVGGGLHSSALLTPIILMPLIFFVLGVSWLLSGFGVYFRDIEQIAAVGTTALFFLTPIIYGIDAVPPRMHLFLRMNPLCSIVVNLRRVLIFGGEPDWTQWGVWMIVNAMFMLFCYAVFMRVKVGFADVV